MLLLNIANRLIRRTRYIHNILIERVAHAPQSLEIIHLVAHEEKKERATTHATGTERRLVGVCVWVGGSGSRAEPSGRNLLGRGSVLFFWIRCSSASRAQLQSSTPTSYHPLLHLLRYFYIPSYTPTFHPTLLLLLIYFYLPSLIHFYIVLFQPTDSPSPPQLNLCSPTPHPHCNVLLLSQINTRSMVYC